jgi:hypothetical protein
MSEDTFKNRTQFKFYKSYYELAKEIDNDKDRAEYLMAICEYQFTGIQPELKGMTKFAFLSQKHSLEKQVVGFKTATDPDRIPPMDTPEGYPDSIPLGHTPNAIKNKEYIIDNNQEESIKVNTKIFIPPALSDVQSYFQENGYSLESANKAFNYYATNNWADSKNNKIKNWKQKMIGVWFKEENKAKINNTKNIEKTYG